MSLTFVKMPNNVEPLYNAQSGLKEAVMVEAAVGLNVLDAVVAADVKEPEPLEIVHVSNEYPLFADALMAIPLFCPTVFGDDAGVVTDPFPSLANVTL